MTHPVFAVPLRYGKLSIMPCPPADDVTFLMARLAASGVTDVVSLLSAEDIATLRLDAEPQACAAAGIAFWSFPIEDFGLPDPARFNDLIKDLNDRLLGGAHLVVHCRAGIGRSGMVAAALLMAQGDTAAVAIQKVSTARGVSIPDTVEQGRFITSLQKS
ncbi:putative protein-tyrosine phosphatase [Sulfitobacter noctilucae]|uniref:protein-tyrosine phosphatase family protein n=1 Tax=Sulfitobacter noctilucae TaxID=1342302 RepID=UPI0004684E26|nr:protein-tyrosine phosphatase family protein [Sulfitobacter noctilucae]KIN65888.1 putative protein-tyrosine phosphatase [Sulfitobacter noctilucae]